MKPVRCQITWHLPPFDHRPTIRGVLSYDLGSVRSSAYERVVTVLCSCARRRPSRFVSASMSPGRCDRSRPAEAVVYSPNSAFPVGERPGNWEGGEAHI
jgi:hypothetical protein